MPFARTSRRVLTALAAFLVVLAAPPARAQSKPPPRGLLASAPADTPVVINPFTVIVTAARQTIPLRENPAATTIVGPAALARSLRGVSIDEALGGVPGIRIDNQADGERVHVSIRGQGILTERGVRGIKVLLDGLPLNDPTGIAPDLYEIDWATVSRVEVLRGPAGALYGGGGSGGVINVLTRDGAAAPFSSDVSFTGGSYGFNKTLAEAGGTNGALNYRVALSHAAGDGYREHNAFWSDHFYGKARWTPSAKVELQQVLAWNDYFEENAEGLPLAVALADPQSANPDAAPFDEYYKVGRFTGGMSGRFALAPGQSLGVTAFLRTTKYREPRPRELQRRQFISPGATVQYDVDAALGATRHHVSVGADAQWQSIDELRLYNPGMAGEDSLLANGGFLQRGAGVFVLDRVELARDWSLMLCGRYDDVVSRFTDRPFKDNPNLSGEQGFQRGTARAGLTWAPTPKLGLYASWGQGFLPPATEELINNPAAYAGFNPDLTFATSNGAELGARGLLPRGLSYEVTGFLLDTKNDFDRYRGRDNLTFYRNLGESRRTGVETRAGWRPSRRLDVDATYTWSRFRYTAPGATWFMVPDGSGGYTPVTMSVDGNLLPNSPNHLFTLATEVEVLRRLTLGIGAEMQSEWKVDAQNSATVPGFALWDASLTWGWRAGTIAGDAMIGARNLFGASYMAFTEPDPDGNSYQPGPRQEYFARVSVRR